MKIHVAGSLMFGIIFIVGIVVVLAAKIFVGMVLLTLAVVFKVAIAALVITLLFMLYWKLRKTFSKANP